MSLLQTHVCLISFNQAIKSLHRIWKGQTLGVNWYFTGEHMFYKRCKIIWLKNSRYDQKLKNIFIWLKNQTVICIWNHWTTDCQNMWSIQLNQMCKHFKVTTNRSAVFFYKRHKQTFSSVSRVDLWHLKQVLHHFGAPCRTDEPPHYHL